MPRADALADERQMVIDLPHRRRASGTHAADNDLSELFPVQRQQSPEGSVFRLGMAVPLAPGSMVPEKLQEGRLVERAPIPFRPECRDRLRRARQ